MVRVLQLVRHESDFQTRRSVEILSRAMGKDYQVERRTIGRGGDYRGVVHAAGGLRKEREFDVIHAWGETALSAAALGFGGKIIYSPEGRFTVRAARWVRAVMGYRDVQVVCPTSTWRKMMVERGVELARCHLIRPGVDFGRARGKRNLELRKALGFGPDDHVVLAPGESDREWDHELGLWSVSILHVLNEKQKMLAWGRGDRARALGTMAKKLGQPTVLTLAERKLKKRVEFEDLLGAADSVLVTAEETAPTLPILICMAAGLPIISTVNYTTGELLEDRHTALMVMKRSAKMLAQRILDVQKDSQLQWAISDMAKTEAYAYFAMTRFINQWREVYRLVSEGRKVEVVEESGGAGMRFHGRA